MRTQGAINQSAIQESIIRVLGIDLVQMYDSMKSSWLKMPDPLSLVETQQEMGRGNPTIPD